MKIEQERKIKSIESKFLKLSKNDNVRLLSIARSSESLTVGLYLFDSDIGDAKVSIEAMSPLQIENLQIVLEMLQGSA